jgi:hypothetical protein
MGPPHGHLNFVSLMLVAYASGNAGGGSVSPRRVAPVVTSFPGPVTMRPLSADRGPVASRREQLARDTLRHLGATTLGDASYSGTYGAQVCHPCRGLFPPGTTPSRSMCVLIVLSRESLRSAAFVGLRGQLPSPPLLFWLLTAFCLHPPTCWLAVRCLRGMFCAGVSHAWRLYTPVLKRVCCEWLFDCRLASHHHRVATATATATRVSSISRARVPPAPPSQPGIYTLGCMAQTPLACTRTLAASVQAAEEHCPRARSCGQLLWAESRR